jgi:aspartate carbamoyltransferase regulatory subunit
VKELKVQPIRNGTVIDHIPPGRAPKVLEVLGLPRPEGTSIVSAVMNVPSKKTKRKDIVKVEDRELRADELSKIALIAPDVTINIIREFDVAQKSDVELPDTVKGLIDCQNPSCVTNHEPTDAAFDVLQEDPPQLKCRYCERVVDDVASAVV